MIATDGRYVHQAIWGNRQRNPIQQTEYKTSAFSSSAFDPVHFHGLPAFPQLIFELPNHFALLAGHPAPFTFHFTAQDTFPRHYHKAFRISALRCLPHLQNGMHFPETPNIAVATAVLDSSASAVSAEMGTSVPGIEEDVARHSYFGAVIKNGVVLAVPKGTSD
jgi:hypothetical protein